MNEQTSSVGRINEYNQALGENSKRGRPKGSSNLHSKHPSGIANRLKLKGFDWIQSFGIAIQKNDKVLLSLWLRLLPYLVVTTGHRRVKQLRGKASKRAIAALDELEDRQ